MLKALRELGEFALGIVFDCFELITMLQVPVVATSTRGSDKMKALQLSAFVVIIFLIVWASTTRRTNVDPITIAVLSVIYLSISSWLVKFYLSYTAQYTANSDLRNDALSVVLAFNLIVVVVATAICEIYTYLDIHTDNALGLQRISRDTLTLLLLLAPALFAGLITLVNSVRYKGEKSYLSIVFFTLMNAGIASLYVYFVFLKALEL